MNKQTYREIQILSGELEVGDTIRVLCPSCRGGSTEEKSLSLHRTDDGGVVYHCFRASCECEGGFGGVAPVGTRKRTSQPHKTWDGETVPLPAGAERWLNERWHMDVPDHWYWTEDMGGRLAMSIRTPQNTHRGWVLRHIGEWKVRTKAYTFFAKPDTPKASWYRNHLSANTVLVEDIPSAVRASEYMNAVALMGTGVTPATAEEIRERATGRVIVALDADATDQAIKLVRKHALLWGDVSVAILTKDLKDQTEEELCQTINQMPS